MTGWASAGLVLLAVVVAGCGSAASAANGTTQMKMRRNGNFVLYVSNQSFAKPHVDITIRIDGKIAVTDQFAVGDEHNWTEYRFELAPGIHHLTAVSPDGHARFAGTFRLKKSLHGVVNYWYAPGNPGGGRKLTFTHTTDKIAFA